MFMTLLGLQIIYMIKDNPKTIIIIVEFHQFFCIREMKGQSESDTIVLP